MEYRFPRNPLRRPVTVVTMRGAFCGTMCNLSRSGCAITGLPPMPAGTRITLDFGFGHVRAQIVWQRLGKTGLRLGRLLATWEMARICAEARRGAPAEEEAPSADVPHVLPNAPPEPSRPVMDV